MKMKIEWLGCLWMLFLVACTPRVTNPEKVDAFPVIYPDYMDVTIPPGIAPLNFYVMEDKTEQVDVVVKGSRNGTLQTSGEYAAFDLKDWRELTEQNAGGTLTFTVCALVDGQWKQYRDFSVSVSKNRLDDYGLTYRRIPPGYEVGGNIGLYQRNIHTFEEKPMLTEMAVPGRCFNCHTSNRTHPRHITMQVRGEGGGTLIQKEGVQQWYNTKTDSTRAAGSYAYWHPDGNYVAYAANSVHQSFFVGKQKPIEVYHLYSNVVLLDTRTQELIADKRLTTPDWLEIFPAFSADGKTLYYSTSQACNVPAEYEKVKCSLVSIPFDAASGRFGEKADTLLNGEKTDKSYVLARPSYDGKWLMYVQCSRSNFPIAQPDADLWVMNLANRETKPLDTVNSEHTESYPNWSSNSKWFVFSSKRQDGMYTRLYIAGMDENGNATKPFLLPQENPKKYYHELFDAYNVPDFTSEEVEFDVRTARKNIESDKRIQVTIR